MHSISHLALRLGVGKRERQDGYWRWGRQIHRLFILLFRLFVPLALLRSLVETLSLGGAPAVTASPLIEIKAGFGAITLAHLGLVGECGGDFKHAINALVLPFGGDLHAEIRVSGVGRGSIGERSNSEARWCAVILSGLKEALEASITFSGHVADRAYLDFAYQVVAVLLLVRHFSGVVITLFGKPV